MQRNYDESLKRLLVYEGGYTNHPKDPGGPTNFGITIHDYRKYIKSDGTAIDVKNMRLEDAKKIYKTKYWDVNRCDELPSGVDFCIFDYGVNSGVSRSAKVLQRLVGTPVTGKIDAATVKAANEKDPVLLVKQICDERINFLRNLKTWPTFGAGWGSRVAQVRKRATEMAKDNTVPAIAATTPAVAGSAIAGVTYWDWIVANPRTSTLIAVAIVLVTYGLYRFLKD